MLNSRNSISFSQPKVFGVALDASDDFQSIELKHAAAHAREYGAEIPYDDPYDALIPHLVELSCQAKPLGKVSTPSWLRPIPDVRDCENITTRNLEAFVIEGGVYDLSRQVEDFVSHNILPGLPVMLGIDHSMTGGVVSALSKFLGAENLSVLVLDQHFDGLPLSMRLSPQLKERFGIAGQDTRSVIGVLDDSSYCCGNFWKHLIDSNVVMPENLQFIGVADYPPERTPPEWERFRENYLEFKTLGCNFFPLDEFEGEYTEKLKHFICEKTKTPYVYVSLDLDVGAYQCVHAARYMDKMGIEEQALMDIAHSIADLCHSDKHQLVGIDVMEFNLHFLGLTVKPGQNDETLYIAMKFLKKLLDVA